MTYPVIDVAVFTNVGLQGMAIEMLTGQPHLSEKVDLGYGVSIAPIQPKVADYVLNLCSPHGFKTKPKQMFHVLYAFVREADADDSGLKWDPGDYIQTAIALSRIAHPTSIGFEDAARLFMTADRTDVHEAVPGPIKGFGAHAFVTDDPKNWRNWLTKNDAILTGRLMGAYYRSKGVCPRIERALWFHEYTARTCHLDLRWVLVVTGLEALINVDKQQAKQQFRTRTVGLANRYGVPWTDEDANKAYALRSEVAHGQNVADSGVEGHDLYRRMEEVLRTVIREALLDTDFGLIFTDEKHIKAEWPLPGGRLST